MDAPLPPAPHDLMPPPAVLESEPRTPEERIALLELRLTQSEAARTAAEALAADTETLKRNLARRTQQLLNAQRVAGIGTMLWDVGAGQLELSPQIHAMFALPRDKAVHSYRRLLRAVLPEDRRKLLRWIHGEVLRGALPPQCAACDPNSVEQKPRIDTTHTGNGEGRFAPAPRCRSDDFQIELRCLGTDGEASPRWMRIMAQFEYGDDCHVSQIFATVQDITRQVNADEEAAALREREQIRLTDLENLNKNLVVARENAQQAHAAKSRFLAMMSHDIRTPLNGVIGILTLLDSTELDYGQRRMVDLVRSSGEQLRVLLNDIIDLARAEAGKLQLNPAPANLIAALADSVDIWRSLAREKDLSLDLAMAPYLPAWVTIDRVRFRQLLDNLISNAIKFTQRGGIEVRSAYRPDNRLRIEVTDTGIGVPPERRAGLFEDFGQSDPHGSEPGGAGLGLAICRRITETMGGTIGLEDTGSGSCFWFEIPCPPTEAPTQVTQQPSLSLPGAGGRAPYVLVAEDISTNRIVAEGYLRKLGCKALLVENGALAVEAVKNETFDLVLMDMAMPVMDGPEATRQIRALGDGRGTVPIIALTAFARTEELAPMMAAGANGSVAKPIVLQDLYNAMAQALGQ